MRFTVANKTILGFVILALTILMVGIGGLRSISQLDSQIQQITDENIPQLVASYDQSLSIYQANESLLVYLTAEEPEEMALQQKAFAKHYATFEHYIDLLTSRNQVAELDAVLQKLRDSAGQYNQYANQIKAAHKQRIALDKEATEQLQGLQAKLESVTTWVQKMSRLAEGKPDLTKAFRAISTDVNQVRVAIRQYQLNGDLERLLSEAQRLRKQLATDMEKLLALEKKARLMQRHVNLVIDALLPEQGVVNAYQQLTAEQQHLANALDKAKQQLAVTRQTSAELINATDQHNMQVRTDAHDTYVTMRAVIIGLIIAALVAAVIIGTLVTTTIQRPLKQVSKRLRALGAGDLTVSFDDSRKDEFGDLAGDLNRVVSQLHEVMQLIIEKSGELAGTAKDNTQISHETTDAMQRQGKQLASTSSTANELELSVGEVASHVKATLTALQDCRALTESASQHVNNTSGSITGQANEIAVAVEMSEQLEVSSKEIDNILDTINSIAGQTNLLALNAAIEAARAGSHGRGFAVVADEVRALASRTHHSTEEIQQMVETMQDQIQKVAERLRNSQSKASSCVELSTASTAALGELELSINRIADMSEQIREATDRQNSSVDSVSQHLVEINQVAQSTAQSAELSASRGDELLEIAESQRQLTQRFTL